MLYRRIIVTAAAALLLAGTAAFADPPSTVGRLSFAAGPVSFMLGSLDDWAPALANYPLTAGDHLWTDVGGRAEVHVGSTALRLDSDTEMSFLSLDDQTLQVSLSQGSINIRLRTLEPGDTVEIDTPNSVVTLLQPGDYRVDASSEDQVDVTVRAGLADVLPGSSPFDLTSGSSVHLSGPDSVIYWEQPFPAPDAWDAWCASRDARENQLQAVRYVPREMIGVEDLDGNGVWMTIAPYGPVWYPASVPAGWAPYHFGRWAWVEPWGWTWIDDQPWGFAPFHYGRWAFVQSRWVWIPGAIVARPVYAPALVVFVGAGGPDQVGWFPLGPREVYVPPYQSSTTYIQRLNVTSVADITIQVIERINVTQVVYANHSVSSAVTVVPRQSFLQSRPTSATVLSPNSDVGRAPVLGMDVQIQPQRESIAAQELNPQRPAYRPPQNVETRRVYSRTTPAPAPRPFTPAPEAAAPARTPQAPAQQPPAQQPPAQQAPARQTPAQQTPPTRPQPTQPVTKPLPAPVSQPPQGATRPTGTTPQTPAAQTPPAQTPAAQTPPAQTPAAQTPPAQAPAAQTPPAQTPAAQTPAAQAPPAQTPNSRGNDPQSLIATMNSRTIPTAERHLEDARGVRGISLDYAVLRKQLQDIRTSLGAVQKTASSGKTDEALRQLKDLQDKVAAIEAIIANAVKAAGGAGSDRQGGGNDGNGRQGGNDNNGGQSQGRGNGQGGRSP